MVFVNGELLLSPEGIVGDYPIAEIKDKKSVAKYVYLKRLVRQDDTGIWTVIGYDPAK
jgi:hypothetical protein